MEKQAGCRSEYIAGCLFFADFMIRNPKGKSCPLEYFYGNRLV